MPRSWDTNKDKQAREAGASVPNNEALETAVNRMEKWTVEDVLTELGGTGKDASHRLAEKMLAARGLEVNKTSLASQMRSINRWLAYERGETGKQVRKPSKDMQSIMNRIGRNAQLSNKGFHVAMSGDISIEGYRRSNRSAMIPMQGDTALAFLENPTFDTLSAGDGYQGLQIEGYGSDLQVSIVT